jgi:hypothetical protein
MNENYGTIRTRFSPVPSIPKNLTEWAKSYKLVYTTAESMPINLDKLNVRHRFPLFLRIYKMMTHFNLPYNCLICRRPNLGFHLLVNGRLYIRRNYDISTSNMSNGYVCRTRGSLVFRNNNSVTAHTNASSRSGLSPSPMTEHISSSRAGNPPTWLMRPCS